MAVSSDTPFTATVSNNATDTSCTSPVLSNFVAVTCAETAIRNAVDPLCAETATTRTSSLPGVPITPASQAALAARSVSPAKVVRHWQKASGKSARKIRGTLGLLPIDW